MNIVDTFSQIYRSYIKPDPPKLAQGLLKPCLNVLKEHRLLPIIIQLSDQNSSVYGRSASIYLKKWHEKIIEIISIKNGTGYDSERASALILLKETINSCSLEFATNNRERWSSLFFGILNKVRYHNLNS